MTTAHRIMLVEDSKTQAIKLTDVLEREGWQVEWAATVDSAMDQLNHHSPDLILLDYYLPGMRGDQLCRRIRMNIATRSIPILMMTMEETGEAELHGLASGADDFVSKSADSDILLARIRALLGSSQSQSSFLRSADQHLRRPRLLTIDDCPTYQQYLKEELEQEGYDVEAAMAGRQGYERLLKEPFDCALVDLVMPDMNGIELCRQVAAWRLTADSSIAILMLTGREGKDDLTAALEAGADDFVGKSSDMAVLKGRIRALLRRKFFQEENRRIVQELKQKELETLQAKAEGEAAQARAALNDELERRVALRTAELAEANRNLAQNSQENEIFVYSVSHDLRSPLVNLQGFSSELSLVCDEIRAILADQHISAQGRERGLALLDSEMTGAIRFIQTAVTRLSGIIDALLRLSLVGRVEYECRPVDVSLVVGRVVDSMRATIQEKGAHLTVGTLPRARGDATAIEQVFANLIGNAVNYLEPQRPGSIEIGFLPADEAPEGAGATLFHTYYVKDNGQGIPEASLPKVFQAFRRLHPQAAHGEGIGLTIVRRIVDRHGGTIKVESKVHAGTTFFVSLPAAESPRSVIFWPPGRELMPGPAAAQDCCHAPTV